MNWASIFVFFVVTLSIFSNSVQSPPNPVYKSTPKAAINSKHVNADAQYETSSSDVPSYNVANINTYQVIISYIMDNYKQVYLADVLTIAENTVSICSEYNIDPLFITALLAVESEFNRYAISPSGAKGLGQLMPFNLKIYKVSDPFDAQQNIRGTVRMVKELMDMWKGDTSYALASYFEGENAIKRNKGNPFSTKTAGYVYQVLNKYNSIKQYL